MDGMKRKGIALLLVLSAGVYGAALLPRPDLADAVFSGQVLSVEKVKLLQNGPTESELWRARVSVESATKGAVRVGADAFVYYEQDWRTNYVSADGISHSESSIQACPDRPRISTWTRYQFLCIQKDVGERRGILYVPDVDWVGPVN